MTNGGNMFLQYEPAKHNIIQASEWIQKMIHRTPIFSSKSLNAILECRLYFKCENLQKVGAFKYRGASFAVLSLPKLTSKRSRNTFIRQSCRCSGACGKDEEHTGLYCNAPHGTANKKIAVEGYGAKIVFCEPTLQAREKALAKVITETGATFVHPYDNYTIIAGQATCAKRNFRRAWRIRLFDLSGRRRWIIKRDMLERKIFFPNTKVIGAEPKAADDAFRSLRDGTIQPSVNPNTICDGLLTQLSEKTFSIIKNNVSEIITCSEETIIAAMRMIWERMKIIVESSAAVPLAVVLENKKSF